MAVQGFTMSKSELSYLLGIIWDTFQKAQTGKGLSTEDFTSALKTKLEGIASGAQVNALEGVKLNGTALTVSGKAVNIPVFSGANSSSNGAVGAVPAPTKGNQDKYLKADGSWSAPPDNNTTYTITQDGTNPNKITLSGSDGTNIEITLPSLQTASSSTLGGIKIGFSQTGKKYPVLLQDGKAYVEVPWTNTTYDPATTTVDGLMSATDKTKLNGIAEGATANEGTITGITMNGASKGTSGVVNLGTVITAHQDISGKANLASPTFTGTPKAPTANAGTNTTQIATTEFVGTAITNALSGITGITFEFVQSLPATGQVGTFYFVPDASGSGTNNFIEYVWNASANKFEEIGRPSVDLSGYMKSVDYPLITEAEIDEIVASL